LGRGRISLRRTTDGSAGRPSAKTSVYPTPYKHTDDDDDDNNIIKYFQLSHYSKLGRRRGIVWAKDRGVRVDSEAAIGTAAAAKVKQLLFILHCAHIIYIYILYIRHILIKKCLILWYRTRLGRRIVITINHYNMVYCCFLNKHLVYAHDLYICVSRWYCSQ